MKNKSLYPIIFLNFINMLGFTILIPVLPFIIKQYNGNPAIYGILLATYAFFQFFAAPILGSMADYYGRKPILLISHAGTMLSWVIFGLSYFVPNISVYGFALPLLVIAFSRMTDGLTGGNNAVANAYAADVTEPKDRAKIFGIIGAIVGVALIVGPAIGSASASTQYGYLGTAIVAFLISLIGLIWMILFLKESLPKSKRSKHLDLHPLRQLNLLRKIAAFKGNNTIMNLIVARVLFFFAFSCYTSIIVYFVIERFGLTQQTLGPFLLFVGSFMIVNQAFLVKRFTDGLGEYNALLTGHILMATGLVAITLAPNLIAYTLLYYIVSLGISLCMPTYKAILTNNVEKHRQGEINGIDEALMAGTSAVSPILAGSLYAGIGAFAFIIFAAIAGLSAGYLTFKK